MFVVDCTSHQRNTPYSASRTCEGAHQKARSVHAAFLREYHLSERDFPLLRLSPSEWNEPFAAFA